MASNSKPCEVSCTVDTGLYADTVEWCKDSRFSNILALGTYQLIEDTGVRKGGVQLYNLYETNDGKKGLRSCNVTSDSQDIGVLDMRWLCSQDKLLLITANANHCIGIYALLHDTSNGTTVKSTLHYKDSYPMITSSNNVSGTLPSSVNTLSLSIDTHYSDHTRLVTSDSQGYITMIDSNTMKLSRQWKGHTHEAWVAAFGSCQDKNLIISGGDDCKLLIWDTRQDNNVITKKHDMGVCCVQAHPTNPHLFASGSFDEIATLWDQRDLRKSLNSIPLGGGVWRLKWHPNYSMVMSAASMHAGFHVFDWEKGIQGHYRIEDTHLGYGIDWCTRENELLASCSFYNHSLYLWNCSL